MLGTSAPTSQKSDVRPITFVADYASGMKTQTFTLPIRPEDLTVNRPMRTTVHQTLGISGTGSTVGGNAQGWVDEFGAGLPTITISGHTGWRAMSSGRDGVGSFEELSRFINEQYPLWREVAKEFGRDPAVSKLILVDVLDNFAWEVAPTQFSLRRSKSRPLLMQYNISLQVVNTQVDGGLKKYLPNTGGLAGGLSALDGILGKISSLFAAVGGALATLRGLAATVMNFVKKVVSVLKAVQTLVASVKGFINGAAGVVIGIAKSLSMVAREVFRTFAAVASIPATVKAAFSQIASAFNEVVCIFSNSLKPKKTYQEFDGIYGASNCSSTTGGRAPSAYAGQNAFAAITEREADPVKMSGAALNSLNSVLSSDAVRAPLPNQEIGRHLDVITSGTMVSA
jgi:hypothetical protein